MKSIFSIAGGLDYSTRQAEKQSLADARKRARPVLREWLRRIELDVMSGQLAAIDFLTAKELCNYPSANVGRCYASQDRIGAAIGASARTARSSLKRLREREYLSTKRGGPGRTATWFFCVNGKAIFGGVAFLPTKRPAIGKPTQAAQERKAASGLERKDLSDKPCEQLHPNEHDPPLTPEPTHASAVDDECVVSAFGNARRQRSDGEVPNEEPSAETSAPEVEIIVGEISFAEFWRASGKQGSEGFARAEWRKLSRYDIAAIADRLRSSNGNGFKRGVWSGTWLRDRVWAEKAERIISDEHETRAAGPRYAHAEPGSELWRRERERRRLAGESVASMDGWAAQGRGVTVQL
jgi:hypothetical protein